MGAYQRNYEAIVARLTPAGSGEQRMRMVADELWGALKDQGVSWVGFYLDQPEQPDGSRLVLGPHRDKPACSPIGLEGVCGQALTRQSVRIVGDVSELGDDYIACDPRDRSEIVIPLFGQSGSCWGVLDLDSWAADAFDQADERGLEAVLRAAGFISQSER